MAKYHFLQSWGVTGPKVVPLKGADERSLLSGPQGYQKSLPHANTTSLSLSVSHTCGLTPTFTLEKSQHRKLTLHVKISLHTKFSVPVLCNCPGTLTVFIGGRVTTQLVWLTRLTRLPELIREETISPGQWRWWWKFSSAEVSTVKYTKRGIHCML